MRAGGGYTRRVREAASRAATALFVAAVPVFLVLTFVRVAAVEPRVHEYGFRRYGAVAATGVDRPQLDRAAREIISYFRNGDDLLTIRVAIDGAETPLFNPREVLHMRDVKALMRGAFRVHEIAFAAIVAYVAVFLWRSDRRLLGLAARARTAGALTVALPGAAALVSLVGFDTLFRQFHEISFANDLWQLNPSRDRLIQMYPRGFWFDVTLAVGLLSAAAGGLLALLGHACIVRERRRETARTVGSPAPGLRATAGVRWPEG